MFSQETIREVLQEELERVALASAGGLDVLGLVKLNNVLSLADGIQVTIKNCRPRALTVDAKLFPKERQS